MEDLTFSHRFATGRTITLTVKRKANTKPVIKTSMHCAHMTLDELAEYRPFRNNTVARLMSILTPEEVLAANRKP